MGVIIHEMDKPKNCMVCRLHREEWDLGGEATITCPINGERYGDISDSLDTEYTLVRLFRKNCPLVDEVAEEDKPF